MQSVGELKKRNFLDRTPFIAQNEIHSICIWGSFIDEADFTVVIPTYKRYEQLRTCLLGLLNQKTDRKFQILIVDNCSENLAGSPILDFIREVEDDRIIYFVNQENLGGAGNWNRGFWLSKTEWVSMIHDDDIVNENWARIMWELCCEYSDAKCISCRYQPLLNEFDTIQFMHKAINSRTASEVTVESMLREFKAPLLGAMIKRECYISLGGVVLDSTNFEDYILMAKMCYYGKVILANETLYGYGISLENDSNRPGLWDDILIGQFYLRKQLIGALRTGKPKATFWNVYDLISSVEKHNVHDGVLTGFKYTNVNSNYVYSSCDLRMAEKIMTPIIRVKIRLSSLLEMKHGNIIKLR